MPAKQNQSKPDPLEPLQELLNQLSLTTLSRELPSILARAQAATHSYSQFLRDAIEIELAARLSRKIQRRVRWSKLGPKPTLDKFDWTARPQLSPQVVRELINGRFIQSAMSSSSAGRPLENRPSPMRSGTRRANTATPSITPRCRTPWKCSTPPGRTAPIARPSAG